MPFAIDRWLATLLASVQGTTSAADLLEAAALIDLDYLEDDIAFLMRDLEADLKEAESRRTKKTPPGPPASS